MISKGSTLWVNQRRKSIRWRNRDILGWIRKVKCREKLLEREKTAKWTLELGSTILNSRVEVELYSYLDHDGSF